MDGDKNDIKVVVMISSSTSLPTTGMTMISTKIGDSILQIFRHSLGDIRSFFINKDPIKDTRWLIDPGATII